MEQKRNVVLQGTEAFSRGGLDNVALENGCLVLDTSAGRYLQYGCYTTPEMPMPAFCNLSVSWNADMPENTLLHAQCRVYAGGKWSGWMSFGKWAPDYPRASVASHSEDNLVFLLGDTVTVATPGGATGVQLQVSLSSNNDKVTPAVRLLAVCVRPLAWDKQPGKAINRTLYMPEYAISCHDPSFGRDIGLPLVVAGLINRRGEDILPEEVAYTMLDMANGSTRNAAYAVAAAGCCGYPCWQAWMDLRDLRAQVREGCPVAVELQLNLAGLQKSMASWMGLRGFIHDESRHVDTVLLNDPNAPTEGAVLRSMALQDFMRYFTGRAIVLRPRPRGVGRLRPRRIRCDMHQGENGVWYFEQRGVPDPLPEEFGTTGWAGCAVQDGVAHATTAHKTFRRMGFTPDGGLQFPQEVLATGGRCSVYAVDRTGVMRVAEVRLPKPKTSSPGGGAGADAAPAAPSAGIN